MEAKSTLRPSLLLTVELDFIDSKSNITLLGSAKLVLEDDSETVSELACRATNVFAKPIIEHISTSSNQNVKGHGAINKLIFKYSDGTIACINTGNEKSGALEEFSAFVELGLVSVFCFLMTKICGRHRCLTKKMYILYRQFDEGKYFHLCHLDNAYTVAASGSTFKLRVIQDPADNRHAIGANLAVFREPTMGEIQRHGLSLVTEKNNKKPPLKRKNEGVNEDSSERKANGDKVPAATTANPSQTSVDPSQTSKNKRHKKMADPDAPKKPHNAFMYFSNSIREKVKQSKPGITFGELAKEVGRQFKQLTAEERMYWEGIAKQNKEVYDLEFSEYHKRYPDGRAVEITTLTDTVDNSVELSNLGKVQKSSTSYSSKEFPTPTAMINPKHAHTVTSQTSKTKRGKKVVDPHAPKKPHTAFIYFSNSIREKVKQDNPGISFTDMGRELGKQFKQLNAETRKYWEGIAKQNKEVYDLEVVKFGSRNTAGNSIETATESMESPEGDTKNAVISSPLITSKETAASPTKIDANQSSDAACQIPKSKRYRKNVDPDAPKKPHAAFIYFSNSIREKVKQDNPGISFADLGRELGKQFKQLPAEEKQHWEGIAQQNKAAYELEMIKYRNRFATQKENAVDGGTEKSKEEGKSGGDSAQKKQKKKKRKHRES